MKTNHVRRRFIKITASSVLLPIVTTCESFAAIKPKSRFHDAFRFVDMGGLGPEQTGEYVENNYCPIHKEKLVVPQAISAGNLEASRKVLIQEFKKRDLPWKPSYNIVWTSQHYGVTDISDIEDDLLHYCRKVHEFLYCSIEGLLDIKINWQRFPARDDCSKVGVKDFNAYVGRYIYSVVRVRVTDESRQYQGPYLIYARPLERSLNFISSSREDFTMYKSTIFIIPGLTSLISPMSELLHISTNAPSLTYAKELAKQGDSIAAQEQARHFGETITEAISISLIGQYLRALELHERVKQLGTLAQHMSVYLPLLGNALSFCHEQGVQECFNAFQENPGFLKKRIEAYL